MKRLNSFMMVSILAASLSLPSAAQTEPLHDNQLRSYYVQKLTRIEIRLAEEQGVAEKSPTKKNKALVIKDKAKLATWIKYCSRLHFSDKRSLKLYNPPVISLI